MPAPELFIWRGSFRHFYCLWKHNNKINAIIIEALNTPKEKWHRTSAPIARKFETSSVYAPEDEDSRNPEKSFVFEKLHHAKNLELNTLDKIFLAIKENGKRFTTKLISRTDNEMCYECIYQLNPQIRNNFKEHSIEMMKDLGNGEFRHYAYGVKYRFLTEEEKAHFLKLFEYMEAQIKNVPS